MTKLNPTPTFRYPPVGRCIYCGSEDRPLTDEHPIPLSLGGHLLLPKASCTDCASKTHYYEGVTARTTFGNLRMRFGFPTRRKKERPTHIEVGTIEPTGTRGRRMIPVSLYPAVVFLPHFGRAGYFMGSLPSLDTLQWVPRAHSTDDVNSHMQGYGFDGEYTTKFMPVELGQTIIKICYAYAVAEFGFDSFDPMCLDQILSKDKNISYIFGQKGQTDPTGGETIVWKIELLYNIEIGKRPILVANCIFLEKMGMPVYEVILGEINNQRHFEIMSNKISQMLPPTVI